ncbi:MAG: hypothetical protein LC634_07875 [Sphingomonadales bacterium]|nr:hypothetical protein [Sphingomonadales bacterium]
MKARLRLRAAEAGRSMEEEVRQILRKELERTDPESYSPGMAPRPGEGFGSYLVRISRPGVDLDLPEREVSHRDPPDFR